MRHFHKLKNHYHCPIINLDKLWTLVGEEKRVECAKDKSKAPVIDSPTTASSSSSARVSSPSSPWW